MGQPLMSGSPGRELAVSDSSVSQDYSACDNAALCSCHVTTLLQLLFPLLCPSFEGISLHTPYSLPPHPLLMQTGTQGYSRYPLLFGEILSLVEEE